MNELRLEIKNDPKIYRELYYRDGYRTMWEYVKKATLVFGIFLSAAIALLVFGMKTMDQNDLILFGIIFLGIVISFGRLFIRIDKYRRWKAPIDAYIGDITRYRNYWIVLTDTTVEMHLDGIAHIEKIEQIVHSSIYPEYISFGNAESPTKYLIPKAAVRQHEYEKVKSFIKEKLKQG